MRKNLLSACLIFITINAMCQTINYIPYYHLVNRAKLVECIDANYDSAIVYYSQAFAIVDYVLAEQLRDFIRCAIMLENDNLVYFAMDKCIEQTVPLSTLFHFTSDSLVDKYKNTEEGRKYYTVEQENKEKYIEKYINPPHKKILDSLSVSDITVRKKWRKGSFFYRRFPNSKKTQELLREWKIVDSCNRLVLDEMIKKYDFPNERNGLFNNPNFIIGGGGIVLVHYDDSVFFKDIEYKMLIEGKLFPDYYAFRAHRIVSIYNLPKTDYTFFYSERQSKKMTTEEKAQVDKNRYRIGLPSVEEEIIIKQCNRHIRLESQKETKKKEAQKK